MMQNRLLEAGKTTILFERMLQVGVGLLFFLPLISSQSLLFPHNATKAYALMALCQVLGVGAIWVMQKRGEVFGLDALSKAVTAFVFIILLASVLGIDPVFSFWASIDRITGGIMWVHLLVLYFSLRILLPTKESWFCVFVVSVSVALLTGAAHALEFLGIHIPYVSAEGSTIGNSSFFAAYLLFQIAYALLLTSSASKRVRYFGGLSFGLLVLTLVSLTANAAIISFVGACMLGGGIWLLGSDNRNVRWRGLAVVCLLGLTFVGTVSLAFVPDSLVQETFTRISSSSRFIVWDMAVQAIAERPLLGWGPENFQYVSLDHYDPCLGSSRCGSDMWYDRAHNKLLDVAVDTGLLGLASYLSVFVIAAVMLVRGIKKERWVGSVLVALLAAYFVQNLTVLDVSTTMLFWMVTLAYISTQSQQDLHTVSVHPNLRHVSVLVGSLLILPLAFTFFVYKPWVANAALVSSSYSLLFEERADLLPTALYGSPQGEDIRRVYGANILGRFFWDMDRQTLSAFGPYIEQELDLYVEALFETISASPNYLRGSLAIGLLEQIYGRFYDAEHYLVAERVLLEAIELNPVHPEPYWTLASLYLETGRVPEALDLLGQVSEFAPELEKSYYYLVLGSMFLSNEEESLKTAQGALRVHPSMKGQLETLLRTDVTSNRALMLYQFHQ